MIMAARAVNGQPEHPLSCGGNHIVEIIEAIMRVVFFAELDTRAGAQKARRNSAVEAYPVQFVSGQLFCNKDIVGCVLIKRLDYVIAVAPGSGPVPIVLETAGISVARHVEPVPAPSFTVMRGG